MVRAIIIEHLEPHVSPWLMSEYRYVSKLFKEVLIFTNVRREDDRDMLKGLGLVLSDTAVKVVRELKACNVIVLDPQAKKELKRAELVRADAVIIGGIMGDHPPRGRTRELLTSKFREELSRNLGRKQLTIAGTAYVLWRMLRGAELRDIAIKEGLTIEVNLGRVMLTIELPYAFPYDRGKPVIPEDYIDVVARRTVYYEGAELYKY
ncbi:MAG: hypothetical protein B6U73_01390 [Desulfurococcales archaeon ex4484_204]|nr:MAG: hypothetical protein B6U73_01390 [Desulfurococcales archaeon ex4484_204]